MAMPQPGALPDALGLLTTRNSEPWRPAAARSSAGKEAHCSGHELLIIGASPDHQGAAAGCSLRLLGLEWLCAQE